MLRLTAEALASETNVSLRTISRAEGVDGPTALTLANAERIRDILKNRGVIFIDDPSEGPGVRLRLRPPPCFGNG
jgi:hypothetical protein